MKKFLELKPDFFVNLDMIKYVNFSYGDTISEEPEETIYLQLGGDDYIQLSKGNSYGYDYIELQSEDFERIKKSIKNYIDFQKNSI